MFNGSHLELWPFSQFYVQGTNWPYLGSGAKNYKNKLGLSCAKLRPALVYLLLASGQLLNQLHKKKYKCKGYIQLPAKTATTTYHKQALDGSMDLLFKAGIGQSCPITCLVVWMSGNGNVFEYKYSYCIMLNNPMQKRRGQEKIKKQQAKLQVFIQQENVKKSSNGPPFG